MIEGSSIIEAVKNNDYKTVKELISKGVDVNTKIDGETPLLFLPIGLKNKEILELLIDAGASVFLGDKNGISPLIMGCTTGNREIVELLISKGADVNQGDYNNVTPLHITCLLGKTEIVKLLISKGADVNVFDRGGVTPLIAARKKKNLEIIALLHDNGAIGTTSTSFGCLSVIVLIIFSITVLLAVL